MNLKKATFLIVFTIFIMILMSPSAFAQPFLCPVVGDGVLNADAHNGDHGVSAITPSVGTSFLPGKNKAGEKANPNAYNTDGPTDPNAGPGHNPNFSPIWPG